MPVINLAFRLVGKEIPADHGYLLYSGLCKLLPELHPKKGGLTSCENEVQEIGSFKKEVAILPISGRLCGSRRLSLTNRSRLIMRIDSEQIPKFLPLAGKQIRLAADRIRIGIPDVFPLRPSTRLYSRIVIIKGFLESEYFLEAVRRQIESIGIKGSPEIPRRLTVKAIEGFSGSDPNRCPFVRRTMRIRDKEIVGYAVKVSELDAKSSILLQERGIGGRRRFGCGVFIPYSR